MAQTSQKNRDPADVALHTFLHKGGYGYGDVIKYGGRSREAMRAVLEELKPEPFGPDAAEVLARLLFERHGGAGPPESGGPATTPWEDLGELVKAAYRETAQQVLDRLAAEREAQATEAGA